MEDASRERAAAAASPRHQAAARCVFPKAHAQAESTLPLKLRSPLAECRARASLSRSSSPLAIGNRELRARPRLRHSGCHEVGRPAICRRYCGRHGCHLKRVGNQTSESTRFPDVGCRPGTGTGTFHQRHCVHGGRLDRRTVLHWMEACGENLAEVLNQRAHALLPPIQMSDALSRNSPKVEGVEPLQANLRGARKTSVVEVADNFPEECR